MNFPENRRNLGSESIGETEGFMFENLRHLLRWCRRSPSNSAKACLAYTLCLILLLCSPALANTPFRIVSYDRETNVASGLVVGRSMTAPGIRWRPIVTEDPASANFGFTIPTARTSEFEASIQSVHPNCKIRRIDPAETSAEAKIIDLKSGRILKTLNRNKPNGGEYFVYNDNGYQFLFSLSKSDLSAPGAEKSETMEKLFLRPGSKTNLAIEISARLDGGGARISYTLSTKKLGAQMVKLDQWSWKRQEILELLVASDAMEIDSDRPLTDSAKLAAATDALREIVKTLKPIGVAGISDDGESFSFKPQIATLGVSVAGKTEIPHVEIIRFELDSLE
jgi:hypothetical protein